MTRQTAPTSDEPTARRAGRATLADIQARDGARAFRSAEVGAIDAAARTVQLAFSSEAEVERWFGFEILSHDPDAVVTTRLSDGAALLLEHDRDRQIGIVESVSIGADRRGRAVVRFGKGALAEEVFQDVMDGIRRHVSVGYRIHAAKLIEERDDGDVWRITKWEPIEISIVSVPADHSVGVGRAMDVDKTPGLLPEKRHEIMKENNTQAAPAETASDKQPAAHASAAQPSAEDQATARGWENERARARTIAELGEMYHAPELARDAIAQGTSVSAFRSELLRRIEQRASKPLSDQVRAADIGMTEREIRNYRFLNVVRALAEPTNRRLQEEAAFEFEASRAAAERAGRNPEGVMIPADVLTRALNTSTTGSASGDTGGHLIANTLMASSFIDLLRNRSTILQLSTAIGGLTGNIDIPRQNSGGQGYWVGEDEDAGQANQDFGQIPGSPKTVAAYSEITRRMLKQSSLDVEALVRSDLTAALALTIDKAGYYGSGTDKQPRGIASQTGLNAVQFKADNPTFAELVAMETKISQGNADVLSMAYVANAGFRGHAKTTLKFEGVGGTIWEPGNTVNGYRTEITNQINAGDVFMGNFADLVVLMWGGLELNVDPYSNSKSGRLRIITFQDIDLVVRRTESFCLGRKS